MDVAIALFWSSVVFGAAVKLKTGVDWVAMVGALVFSDSLENENLRGAPALGWL